MAGQPDGTRHASQAARGGAIATVRSFVAVLLDEATRAALGAETERLRAVARDVAWVAPENFHITLKFLGAIDLDRVEVVAASLGKAVAGAGAFEVVVEGLGAFPSPTRARVVWAGVTGGHEPLARMAARVEQTLAEVGFPPEERAFSPHVTLGRVREPRRNSELAAAIDAAATRRFGARPVGSVSLMRSDLSPRGARYTELVSVPFHVFPA